MHTTLPGNVPPGKVNLKKLLHPLTFDKNFYTILLSVLNT